MWVLMLQTPIHRRRMTKPAVSTREHSLFPAKTRASDAKHVGGHSFFDRDRWAQPQADENLGGGLGKMRRFDLDYFLNGARGRFDAEVRSSGPREILHKQLICYPAQRRRVGRLAAFPADCV